MNAKQTIPAIAKIAPPLMLGALVFLALKEIFSTKDTEKKPETAPANTGTESNAKSTVVPLVAAGRNSKADMGRSAFGRSTSLHLGAGVHNED